MLEDVVLTEHEIMDHNEQVKRSLPSPGIWAVAMKSRRSPTVGKGGFNLLPKNKLSQSINLGSLLNVESSRALLSVRNTSSRQNVNQSVDLGYQRNQSQRHQINYSAIREPKLAGNVTLKKQLGAFQKAPSGRYRTNS